MMEQKHTQTNHLARGLGLAKIASGLGFKGQNIFPHMYSEQS